jgi:hypothetical protein
MGRLGTEAGTTTFSAPTTITTASPYTAPPRPTAGCPKLHEPHAQEG